MNETKIPDFKKKELSPQYLSEEFEDQNQITIKLLFDIVLDFKIKLELRQMLDLMDYQYRSEEYTFELMAILTGGDVGQKLRTDLEGFRFNYSPKSDADKLIFNVFKAVSDEIIRIDEILKMQEEFIEGDNDE